MLDVKEREFTSASERVSNHPQVTVVMQFRVQAALPEKSLIGLLLCATSAFSVPLWLFLLSDSEPQRHKEHRACTEKSHRLAFRAKPVRPIHSILIGSRCQTWYSMLSEP